MIHLRKPWTRQPQTSHRLRSELGVLVGFVGSRMEDLATHTPCLFSNGATIRPGPAGLGAVNSGSTDSIKIYSDRSNESVSTGGTIYLCGRSSDVTTQQSGVTKTVNNGDRNTPFDFGIISGTPLLVRANATDFRAWRAGTTSRLSNDTDFVVAVRFSPYLVDAPQFWVNGVLDTADAFNLYGGTATGTATTNTNPVQIGNRADLATQWLGGPVYAAFVCSGLHTDALIAKATSSPRALWEAMLAPRRILIPVAAAGGAPTITALSARLITTTSAQPRISYS